MKFVALAETKWSHLPKMKFVSKGDVPTAIVAADRWDHAEWEITNLISEKRYSDEIDY